MFREVVRLSNNFQLIYRVVENRMGAMSHNPKDGKNKSSSNEIIINI